LEDVIVDLKEIGWNGMEWINWLRIGIDGGIFCAW
jgi:hypothetical protein